MKFHLSSKVLDVKKHSNGAIVTVETGGKTVEMESDIVLMSVGRKPNTDGLNLEAVGIKTDPKEEFQWIKIKNKCWKYLCNRRCN